MMLDGRLMIEWRSSDDPPNDLLADLLMVADGLSHPLSTALDVLAAKLAVP